MTLYQFKTLDEAEQIEAFWEGIEVGSYEKDGFVFDCKQIDDFYVEYKSKNGLYHDMKCHRNPALLDPYLSDLGNLEI